MHQCITHINDVTPGNFRMLVTKLFCQKIGSLTNNHDVIDNSMEAHNVRFHVFE